MTRKPTSLKGAESTGGSIPTDASWTPRQCAQLFTALRPGQELSFYGAAYPSVSDPGAYLRVQRSPQGGWLYKAANHGWSSGWQQANLLWLQSALYRNRARQGAGVRLTAVTPTR